MALPLSSPGPNGRSAAPRGGQCFHLRRSVWPDPATYPSRQSPSCAAWCAARWLPAGRLPPAARLGRMPTRCRAAVSLRAAESLTIFAAFGPYGLGAWRDSAVGAVVNAAAVGAAVRWWAGGGEAVDLRARLAARTMALVSFLACRPGSSLVVFLAKPEARGRLLAGAARGHGSRGASGRLSGRLSCKRTAVPRRRRSVGAGIPRRRAWRRDVAPRRAAGGADSSPGQSGRLALSPPRAVQALGALASGAACPRRLARRVRRSVGAVPSRPPFFAQRFLGEVQNSRVAVQGCGLAWSLWRRLRGLPGVRRDAFGEARAAFLQRVRTPSARAQRGFEVSATFVQGQARRFSSA